MGQWGRDTWGEWPSWLPVGQRHSRVSCSHAALGSGRPLMGETCGFWGSEGSAQALESAASFPPATLGPGSDAGSGSHGAGW